MNRDYKNYSQFFYHSNDDVLVKENKWISNILTQYLKKDNTKKILDFGCGSGDWLNELYSYSNCLYATDVSINAIRYCKKNYQMKINYFIFDNQNIPLNNNYIDVVIIFWVFQEIIDDKSLKIIISEIKRIIKKNGLIIFVDNLYSDIRKEIKTSSMGELMQIDNSIIRQQKNNSMKNIFPNNEFKLLFHSEYESSYCEIFQYII